MNMRTDNVEYSKHTLRAKREMWGILLKNKDRALQYLVTHSLQGDPKVHGPFASWFPSFTFYTMQPNPPQVKFTTRCANAASGKSTKLQKLNHNQKK